MMNSRPTNEVRKQMLLDALEQATIREDKDVETIVRSTLSEEDKRNTVIRQ
jgi:hypothetical protein